MRVRKVEAVQRELPLAAYKRKMSWGGARLGAGREKKLVHDPSHTTRPAHQARHPSHISVRVLPVVGRLRKRKLWQVFKSKARHCAKHHARHVRR